MARSADRNPGNGESRTPAAIVLEELARRCLSRQQLAEQARISLSTLEKALSGRRPFTLATLVRIEQALGVSLREKTDAASTRKVTVPPELAPDELGSYARAAVSWIEGAYLTIRPSFGDKTALYTYRTEILWDAARSSLVFRESERIDAAFSQQGFVSVPNFSGHIYLVTNEHGQYRLIVVSRPSISGEMHGILTTLQVGRGAHLIPVATPIALVPLKRLTQVHFGRIHAGYSGAYAQYRALLRRTLEEPFALFLSP
ncbi:MAG TPA: helix-turn-helix transcriptional regulator [Hyphomicrobiaceae bacterium]|jgi:transcriptional regulator with XRE-family HTH domain|nr:helix-turn-helix transcriptional regulator [Hyphomicrobiaceae bacterium]